MEMRNCPECGKVFSYLRTNLCPACQEKDEENFKIVRAYIIKNPSADLLSVSENTGISEAKIIRYLREGRITAGIPTADSSKLVCEVCGVPVANGRLCKACTEKLSSGLKKSIEEENKKAMEEMQKKGPRMHTVDYWKQRNS